MITIERKDLLAAIADPFKASARKSTIPILSNLLLYAADGRLTIAGSDLDVEMRISVPCTGDAMPFTVPGGTLHDAVRKLPDGATIAIDVDKANANITAGRSRFRLPVLPAGDFPELAPGEMPTSFVLQPAELARMISTVSFAISSEEVRYYLNGIHWHATEGPDPELIAVATDGHRLSKLRWPLPEGAAGMRSLILPRRTIDLLKAFAEGKKPVEISTSEWKARFVMGDLTLTSKLIDGTFPDYQRVIPTGNPNAFTIEKAALHAAVDRVVTISAGKGSAVKFSFGRDILKLTASNPDTGSAEDEVAVVSANDGEDVEIGFSGRYVLDMLTACPAERLTFHLADPGSPARISPEGADDLVFILMPMRV